MDNHLQISTLAAPLLGPLKPEETAVFSQIVLAVQADINAQLRPGVDESECIAALTLAAVLLSVSMMRQLKDSDITDFTAGTLKVSLRNDHSVYAQLADRLIAPWRADGVAFRGVSG